MTKRVIAQGIILIGSKSVAEWDRENDPNSNRNKARAERRAIDEYLSNPANYDDPDYSDVYKDVYGVRPRWLYAQRRNG